MLRRHTKREATRVRFQSSTQKPSRRRLGPRRTRCQAFEKEIGRHVGCCRHGPDLAPGSYFEEMGTTLTALAGAVAIGAAATTALASPRSAEPQPCRAAVPNGPAVPAPIVFWNGCGAFRLERDGSVARLPRGWLSRHGGGTGRGYGAHLALRRTREGSFILRRGGRTLWRSSALYPNDGGSVAFGPGLFAFASYRRGVYMTDLKGPERLVLRGRGLYPIDFTDEGQLLVVKHGTIVVLSSRGEKLARYSYRPRRGHAFDEETDTLYFVTRGDVLASVRGARLRLVRSMSAITGWLYIAEPGVLIWSSAQRVTVMTGEGRVIASAHWPGELGSVDLGLRPSADGRFFAYRVSNVRPMARSATVSLFVLRAGEMQARRVLRHRLSPIGCGVPGGMSWHGDALLYAFGDGRLAVYDAEAGSSTSLTELAMALPRRTQGASANAAWASDLARWADGA